MNECSLVTAQCWRPTSCSSGPTSAYTCAVDCVVVMRASTSCKGVPRKTSVVQIIMQGNWGFASPLMQVTNVATLCTAAARWRRGRRLRQHTFWPAAMATTAPAGMAGCCDVAGTLHGGTAGPAQAARTRNVTLHAVRQHANAALPLPAWAALPVCPCPTSTSLTTSGSTSRV